MAGLDSQSKVKAARRAANMALSLSDDSQPSWFKPPPEDREEYRYDFVPDGAEPGRDRIMVRIEADRQNDETVEFAVVHQTYHQGKWHNVASADSCHDVDVHVHWYGRSTGERVGQPHQICTVTSRDELQVGHDLAYETVVEAWQENRRRWLDA